MNFRNLFIGAFLIFFFATNCDNSIDTTVQNSDTKKTEHLKKTFSNGDLLWMTLPMGIHMAESMKNQESKIPLAALTAAVIGLCTTAVMAYSIDATVLDAENKVLSVYEIESINKTIRRKIMVAKIGITTALIAGCIGGAYAFTLTELAQDLRTYLFPA